VAWVLMGDDDEGQPAVGRHVFEEFVQRFEAAG
jgi:hypothetical protein